MMYIQSPHPMPNQIPDDNKRKGKNQSMSFFFVEFFFRSLPFEIDLKDGDMLANTGEQKIFFETECVYKRKNFTHRIESISVSEPFWLNIFDVTNKTTKNIYP